MSRYRCQICGRRKGLKRDGGIVMHHVQGDRCPGTGHPPLEHGHQALQGEIDRLKAQARAKRAFVRDLLARRVNYIDPAHETIAWDCEQRAASLSRRLKRHLDWPARFERQMATQGHGQPPPAYLISG